MESQKSNALVRRSIDTQLMPPPPKRIKRPRNVIDEKSYTSAISEIIARDFFPGLLETETQQEYLDALESQNTAWISSASRRLEQLMTPGPLRGRRGTSLQTPSRAGDTPRGLTSDTPISVASVTTASASTLDSPPIDTNMSLDMFQSKYTSEDNESFYKLLDTQNEKRAEKYAWMWSANGQIPSKMMLKQKEVETKLLQTRGSLVDDGGEKDRLAIRTPGRRPARPDSWKSKPINGLMFAPDSIEDSTETVNQRAQDESRAAPRSVVYSNTRIPDLPIIPKEPDVPPSPSMSAVRHAIAGKRQYPESESAFDGNETPRVNGYAFVDDEDDAEPISLQRPRTIDLGKGDIIKNPFVIKSQSSREDLHHRMVDKNAKAKRDSSRNGLTGRVDMTPIPKFPSSPRIGSGQLTPAAQRLWSRVGSSGDGRSPPFGEVTGTPRTERTKSSLRNPLTPSV